MTAADGHPPTTPPPPPPSLPMSLPVFTPGLLDRCISCGYCLPACPTYTLTGDETSSPRGRITLMRAVQNGSLALTQTTEESSFCLGCRACETVCPAGVEYGHLLEEWRQAAWTGGRRPLVVRALLLAVAHRWRVRLMGFRRHAGWWRTRTTKTSATIDGPPAASLMLGCFERALYPAVSRAALRLDPTLHVTTRQGCCGALHAHNGELDRGRAMARELGHQLPGVIVTTSGGCAAHLADVIGPDRVREISQHLATMDSSAALQPIIIDGRPARLGLQDSCHLRNGLGVWREPREILQRLGDYIEVPGANQCCGAAGSYALVRPADAARIAAPKVDAIRELHLDYLVTVNPGCTRQMATTLKKAGLATRVIHIAELTAPRAAAAPHVSP